MTTSLIFSILQIASLLTLSLAECQPNLRIPRLYQQTFVFADMHEFQVDQNHPYNRNYKTRYHFPVELLQTTNSQNISYLLAINSIEWKFSPNFMKYRLRVTQKSEISLLIQLDSREIQWTNLKFSVILNDQSFRKGIYFGSATIYSQQNYLADPNPNANSLKKVSVDLPSQLIYTKTTAFLTGVDVKPKGADLLYEFRLTSKLINKKVELAVIIDQNTQVISIQTSFVAWTAETSQTKTLYMVSEEISFNQLKGFPDSIVTEYAKMKEFLPTNNFYMMGINEYKVKQGFGEFKISVASKKQRVIEVTAGIFFDLVSISYFGVSNSPKEICSECSIQKFAYFNNKQTKCVSKCQSPFYIQDYSHGYSACAYCSPQLGQELTHDGKCQCKPGNKCNLNVSFSTKDNECPEDNQEYISGRCVCRVGYQLQNGECKYRCDNGYWDGIKCEECQPNTYPWPELSECRLCQPDCQKCENAFQCQKCNLGFNMDLLLGVCNEVCGDGVNYYDQCDDGNTQNGDGCSQQCKIETGYSCNKDICQQIQLSVFLTESLAISMGYQIILKMEPGPNKKLPREELQEMIKIQIKETQKGETLDPYQIYISQIQQQVDGNTEYGKIRILFNYAGSFPTQTVPVQITINFGSSAKINVDLDYGNPSLSLQNSLDRLN